MTEPYDSARAAVLRVLDEWEVRHHEREEAADAALDAVPVSSVRTENGWGRVEQVGWLDTHDALRAETWGKDHYRPVYRIVEAPDA